MATVLPAICQASLTGIPERSIASLKKPYHRHLDLGRGLATGTREGIMSAINTFIDHARTHLKREPLVSDVTKQNLQKYAYDRAGKLSPLSYDKVGSQLKLFIAWAMKEDYLPWGPNPVEQTMVSRRQTDTTTRNKRLSDAQFLEVLRKATHVRDRFLFLFMRESLRRIGEVVGGKDNPGLKWCDILWDENEYIYDNSKGRHRRRSGVLTPELRAILLAWKEVYETSIAPPGMDRLPVKGTWYVFPALWTSGPALEGRKRDRTLNPIMRLTNANRIVKAALVAAGIRDEDSKGEAWHMFRKTGANILKQQLSDTGREDAWDVTSIALDHADAKTTRIYVDPQEDWRRFKDLRETISIWSPDLMAGIPELAGLVAERHPAPPIALPAPVEPVEPTEDQPAQQPFRLRLVQ